MKIKDLLTESVSSKTVVFNFGRYQPPHDGHKKMFELIRKTAKEHKADWYVVPTKTHDDDKNPLPFKVKVKWLLRMCPWLHEHIVVDQNVRTILDAARWFKRHGYTKVIFVASKTEIKEIGKTLKQYNGSDYKFEDIEFVRSPRIARATDARRAAKKGDEAAFFAYIKLPRYVKVDGMNLYKTVRKYMGCED
jgi:hypothetical protein